MRPSLASVIAALEAGEGRVCVARRLGVGVRTLGRWVASWPELARFRGRGGKRVGAGRKKLCHRDESIGHMAV